MANTTALFSAFELFKFKESMIEVSFTNLQKGSMTEVVPSSVWDQDIPDSIIISKILCILLYSSKFASLLSIPIKSPCPYLSLVYLCVLFKYDRGFPLNRKGLIVDLTFLMFVVNIIPFLDSFHLC